MPTSNSQLVQRADIALADLASNGGLLLPEQANQFMDFIQEEPTMIKQARTIRMARPITRVLRMGFKERILRAARQVGNQNDDGSHGRKMRKADRAAPTTDAVEMSSNEVIAECRIPYELLEDNIEGRNFEAHLLRLIAQRVALDLEEIALWGDKTSAVDVLALQDGWMKKALLEGNVFDNTNKGISSDMFANALLSMPQVYLKYLAQMRGWITHANRIRYGQTIARRQTAFGDTAVQTHLPIQAAGLTVEGAGLMAAGENGQGGLITYPNNLLFGIHRDITIESDKDIAAREYIIVVTARIAVGVEDVDALVRLRNIGGLAADYDVSKIMVVNPTNNPVNTKEVV